MISGNYFYKNSIFSLLTCLVLLLFLGSASASNYSSKSILAESGLSCLRELIIDIRNERTQVLSKISDQELTNPPSLFSVVGGLVRLNAQKLKSFLQHHIFMRTPQQRLKFLENLDALAQYPDQGQFVRVMRSIKLLGERFRQPHADRLGRYTEIDEAYIKNVYVPLENELMSLVDESRTVNELDAIESYAYNTLYPSLRNSMRRLINLKTIAISQATKNVQSIIAQKERDQFIADIIQEDLRHTINEILKNLYDEESINKVLERFYSRLNQIAGNN